MKNFSSQFTGKSPLSKLKKEQDSIRPVPKEIIDAGRKGAAGSLGIIGGAVGAVGKGVAKAAAKAFAKRNPGVTLGGATKNLPKGKGKPRYGKGKTHPIITGGRSMKGFGGR